jgi:hypothetical protein
MYILQFLPGQYILLDFLCFQVSNKTFWLFWCCLLSKTELREVVIFINKDVCRAGDLADYAGVLCGFVTVHDTFCARCRLKPKDCLLTPWSIVLLEKLTSLCSQSINSPHFYGTRKFFIILTSARHPSLFWANSIQSPVRKYQFLKGRFQLNKLRKNVLATREININISLSNYINPLRRRSLKPNSSLIT